MTENNKVMFQAISKVNSMMKILENGIPATLPEFEAIIEIREVLKKLPCVIDEYIHILEWVDGVYESENIDELIDHECIISKKQKCINSFKSFNITIVDGTKIFKPTIDMNFTGNHRLSVIPTEYDGKPLVRFKTETVENIVQVTMYT